MKILVLTLSLLASLPAFSHTGYCRYGEDCSGIVSQDIDEARRICARDPFKSQALAVRQQQADGSIKFIGYVCVGKITGGNEPGSRD